MKHQKTIEAEFKRIINLKKYNCAQQQFVKGEISALLYVLNWRTDLIQLANEKGWGV